MSAGVRWYRGQIIERVHPSGYWSCFCEVPGQGYSRPLLADTLSGLKEIIRMTLDGLVP